MLRMQKVTLCLTTETGVWPLSTCIAEWTGGLALPVCSARKDQSMEIILNKDQAIKAVDVARNFAESASGLKVLQGVFLSAGFGRLRLTTTDLSLWCQVELDCPDAAAGYGFGSGAEFGNGVEERASESRGASQDGRRRGV